MKQQERTARDSQWYIALGTTSIQKIEYIEEVLKEMNIVAHLIPAHVQSGVSEQPLTSKETKEGAINRAQRALSQHSTCQFGMGIEVGYKKNEQQQYEILCWTSIVDQAGTVLSCRSHSFPLPTYFQQILRRNLPLGEYTEAYLLRLQNRDEHAYRYLGNMIKYRKSFIVCSIRDVLIQYVCRDEFNV